MAGGTFTAMNKVRPGVYINFESAPKPIGRIGDRGIVTMALPLSWGESQKVLTINAGDDTATLLGYDITSPQLLLVREAMKRAKTLLLYRLNIGVKAAATHNGLTATARYGGVRGNDISLVVQQDIDDETLFVVQTLLSGVEVDTQIVASTSDLQANDWVVFGGPGPLEATAGMPLIGGMDGAATNADHTAYLSAIELFDFHTMAVVSTDSTLKELYAAFVRRLRDGEGRKVQVVVENHAQADFEGVVSVKNGVVLSDGTILTAAQATVWTAGATAGAQANQSLTYQSYDGAIDAAPRYTNSQIETALRNGEFVFTQNGGRVIVEQDINTLTSFTREKGKDFAKNRVLRVLDGLANDFKRTFELFFIGKVDNNDDGRNLIRKECIKTAEVYQNINAIQNFDAQSDIEVLAGEDKDSIYIGMNAQPVDAVEKTYMKVQVR